MARGGIPKRGYFGFEEKKTTNDDLGNGIPRPSKEGGWVCICSEPMPMRNKTGAVVYYLFFAAHKPVASEIVTSISTNIGIEGADIRG